MAIDINRAALQNLELLAKGVVEGFIIGLHRSPFHGFSVEFAEHRPYNPGDPLRHIDWRVYGRTDRTFVKRYEEETNLRCCLAVDVSASMHYPADEDRISKLGFACLGAASLAHLLRRQQDAAALALFDTSLKTLTPARSAGPHYRRLVQSLQDALAAPPEVGDTALAPAIHEIAERMHRRSLVILFTDAVASDPNDLRSALQHLRYNGHEVVLFHILDAAGERRFDFPARPHEFVDMETGERLKLQPAAVRDTYVAALQAYERELKGWCETYGVDFVPVDLSEPVERVLQSFVAKRARLF